MTKIKIEDGSGDKDFFTIIPNYILNHSTIWDREVYTQMKRIAGENGKCYMSIPNLAKKCGMGKERLKKSIKYLIEHNWIKYLGKIPTITKGGEQLVNTYKIENIWRLNTDFYKGGSPQGYPQDKGGSPQTSKGGRQITEGGSCHACKEEPFKEEPFKEDRETPSQIFKKFLSSSYQEKKLLLKEKLGRCLEDDEEKEIERFTDYWTEPNKSGTKQRWELERTFDLIRRVKTWFNNINKFNKQNYGKNKPKQQSNKFAKLTKRIS